jgi:signal transduction histidine kinase
MTHKKGQTPDASDLRQRAEARLKGRQKEEAAASGEADVRRLVHELEVHQVELEMQNEELQAARAELEAGRAACELECRAVLVDISERRGIEAAREESERHYHEAAEALREADRNRTQFLAMLSHELRNPLAPIKNSLYILDRAVAGGDQAKRAQAVIARQVEQFSRIIDDLLDTTRILSGKVQLKLKLLDLNEVVRQTVEDHRSVFEQNGVHLEASLAARPVVVKADWARMAQVVGNLLTNAAKFTERGGNTRVSVGRDGMGGAEVHVADTGMGMSPEILGRLFEPFTQADRTLDRSRGGIGLGLALVKGFVELHRGEVSAHSAGTRPGS